MDIITIYSNITVAQLSYYFKSLSRKMSYRSHVYLPKPYLIDGLKELNHLQVFFILEMAEQSGRHIIDLRDTSCLPTSQIVQTQLSFDVQF
jgi:hypothetical protein